MTYRNWLQERANSGDGWSQLGLNTMGDDGGINQSDLQNNLFGSGGMYAGALQDEQGGYYSSATNNLNNLWGQYQNYINGGNVATNAPSGPTVDAQTVASYDQAIGQTNNAINLLGQQESVGLGNVAGDFNNNLQRLLNAKNQANQNYEKSKIETTDQNRLARGDIDFATGQRINSLRRLLGSRGAGSSSAFSFAAPQAAAQEGSKQLRQVGDSFSKNMGALDTNWSDYQTNWNQSREDLDTQKRNAESTVRSDVAGKRSNLLSTLAQLAAQRAQAAGGNAVAAAQPYLDQVNNLQSQITNLGAQYFGKVNVANPNYKAPDLAKYDYDRTGAAEFGNASTAAAQAGNPYLATLLGNKKKESGLF